MKGDALRDLQALCGEAVAARKNDKRDDPNAGPDAAQRLGTELDGYLADGRHVTAQTRASQVIAHHIGAADVDTTRADALDSIATDPVRLNLLIREALEANHSAFEAGHTTRSTATLAALINGLPTAHQKAARAHAVIEGYVAAADRRRAAPRADAAPATPTRAHLDQARLDLRADDANDPRVVELAGEYAVAERARRS